MVVSDTNKPREASTFLPSPWQRHSELAVSDQLMQCERCAHNHPFDALEACSGQARSTRSTLACIELAEMLRAGPFDALTARAAAFHLSPIRRARRLLRAGLSPFTICYLLSAICYLLSAICYPLSAICHSQSAASHPLPFASLRLCVRFFFVFFACFVPFAAIHDSPAGEPASKRPCRSSESNPSRSQTTNF